MKSQQCIIVVPIYKENPDELEQLSLKQLDKIINNTFDICFIHPSSVDLELYNKLFISSEVLSKQFDDSYFTSLQSYSKLCLEYNLYSEFSDYEYMLMYQPDCWIFRNEIEKFCNMNYDYIGAPIYSKMSNWPSLLIGSHPVVGNGGLSLRKISKMMDITNPDGYIHKKYENEWNNIAYEDMFICDFVAHDIYMNIPDYKLAETFSIDFLPAKKDNINPMAVHRVFVCYDFWKNMINELNDEHIQELCKIEINKTFSHYNHTD